MNARRSTRSVGRWLAFIVLGALGLFAPATSQADDSPTFADRADSEVAAPERSFALSIDPLAMSVGVYGLGSEIVLNAYAALALEGGIFARDGSSSATVLVVGVVLYPVGTALHGFYLAPRVQVARPLDESPVHTSRDDVLAAGATAGWQWTWDYGLTARVGGGALFMTGGSTQAFTAASPLALGPSGTLVLDSSVGWAF